MFSKRRRQRDCDRHYQIDDTASDQITVDRRPRPRLIETLTDAHVNDRHPAAREQMEMAEFTQCWTRGYQFKYGTRTPSNARDYRQGG